MHTTVTQTKKFSISSDSKANNTLLQTTNSKFTKSDSVNIYGKKQPLNDRLRVRQAGSRS